MIKSSFRLSIFDLLDTKLYGGKHIDMEDISMCNKFELQAMENNAKICSVLFIPFRAISELKDENDKFLNKFRKFLASHPRTFEDKHKYILKNIQNCRNSMNVGRPLDSLEMITTKEIDDDDKEKKRQDNDELLEAYDLLLQNADTMFLKDVACRTENNFLFVNTSIIRNCGASKCGSSLVVTPILDGDENIFLTIDNHQRSQPIREQVCQDTTLNLNHLYNLISHHSVRNVGDDVDEDNIHVTGAIENIKSYANVAFGDDEDQKLAFELIVSAFMVELLKLTHTSGKKRARFPRPQYKKFVQANNKGQFICFLSGPGGSGKIQLKSKFISVFITFSHSIIFLFGIDKVKVRLYIQYLNIVKYCAKMQTFHSQKERLLCQLSLELQLSTYLEKQCILHATSITKE